MNVEVPRWKVFEYPLLPVGSSAIDALPVLLLFALLAAALYGVLRAHRPHVIRWITQTAALLIFVVFMHRCLCAIRGWIFGMRFVARDDLMAFNMLCIILPLVASALVAGRLFCGWVCPLGFIQELIERLRQWTARRMIRMARTQTETPPRRQRGRTVYAILALTIVILLATVTRPAGEVLSQSTAALWGLMLAALMVPLTLGFISDKTLKKARFYSLGAWFGLGVIGIFLTSPWCSLVGGELDYSSLVGLTGVLLASVAVPMAWCRYLCPLGALLSLAGRKALVTIEVPIKNRNEQAASINRISAERCNTSAWRLEGVDQGSCIRCRRCGSPGVLVEPAKQTERYQDPSSGGASC